MDDLAIIEQALVTQRKNRLPNTIKPCILRLMEESSAEKNNLKAFIIATELRRVGKPIDKATKILINWNLKNSKYIVEPNLIKKINSAYGGSYEFGCNNELSNYCLNEKSLCVFHRELIKPYPKSNGMNDYFKNRWPQILNPAARLIYSTALIELEKRQGVEPGAWLNTPYTKIMYFTGISSASVVTGVKSLLGHGLIEAQIGTPRRWEQKATVIKRVLPVPKPLQN